MEQQQLPVLFEPDSHIFFDVRTQPLFSRCELPEQLDARLLPVPSHKVIVRNENGTAIPIAVVGKDYSLVTMREQCAHVERMMHDAFSNGELQDAHVRDSIAYHGQTCLRDYTFPNIRCNVGKRNDIAFRMIMRGSYGKDSIMWLAGAIQFYCSNGMVIGEFEQDVRRHSKHLQIADISTNIHKGIEHFYQSAEKWREWDHRNVTALAVHQFFLDAVANDKDHSALSRKLEERYFTEIMDRGETAWAVYSALTYYSSHNAGTFATRNTANDHAAATMFDRERQVRKWVDSPAWQELLAA